MRGIPSYTSSIDDDYGVQFSYVQDEHHVGHYVFIFHACSTKQALRRRHLRGKFDYQKPGVISVFFKLCTDAQLEINMRITCSECPSFPISSGEYPLFMIRAADTFLERNHQPPHSDTSTLFGYERDLFVDLPAYRSRQGEEIFLTFVMFLETIIQRTTLVSHCIMSIFITAVRPLD